MGQNALSQSDCEFSNQLFCQNKSMKQPHSLHADTNSQKLKNEQRFFTGHGQKWVWPIWSWNSKIDCISRMN